jgi:two-component system sensor histidine kinase DesK
MEHGEDMERPERAVRRDDSLIVAGGDPTWWWMSPLWIRAGQVIGLLFLVGPLSDLRDSSESAPRVGAISVAFAAFIVLYFVLLPPARLLARRGLRAVRAALILFAALAALPLLLRAPESFASLFVYVVAAAALLLPPKEAEAVIAITAAAVGAGFALAGADNSVVAAYALTIVAVGTIMAALAGAVRATIELRAAREELARTAVAEERLRIARDLHDLLGHTLSLIAIKIELARKLFDSDPVRARAELAEVQNVTRHALTEVREAVQGYRRRSFADELEDAQATIAAAGIECRVELRIEELPDEVENVLAWAVREASTNVVRHSGAHACVITLRRHANVVLLQVDDDGATARANSTNGTGLVGLAERARLLHGRLETGTRPDGGFRLLLTLPLQAT